MTVSSIAAKAVVVKNPNFKAETDIEKIRLDQFSLCIRLLSPLHLGAGEGIDYELNGVFVDRNENVIGFFCQ